MNLLCLGGSSPAHSKLYVKDVKPGAQTNLAFVSDDNNQKVESISSLRSTTPTSSGIYTSFYRKYYML